MTDLPQASGRRLAIFAALAFVAATLILVTIVLPAEFGIDPSGFGRLTGLSSLSARPAPAPATAPPTAPLSTVVAGATSPALAYPTTYRSDSFDIPLEFADEYEFKVALQAGGAFVYAWSAEGAATPEALYADFHGEVPGSKPEKLMEYRQASERAANGSLVAPFDGVHGWFFQNRGDERIVVHLKISGFYTLIPAGSYGNSRGIQPRADPG